MLDGRFLLRTIDLLVDQRSPDLKAVLLREDQALLKLRFGLGQLGVLAA